MQGVPEIPIEGLLSRQDGAFSRPFYFGGFLWRLLQHPAENFVELSLVSFHGMEVVEEPLPGYRLETPRVT
jgi:hypothetical protein